MEAGFQALVDFAITLWGPSQTVFIVLGSLVVFGTFIDSIVPDEYDKGFMSIVFKVPVLGAFLKFISKFSPFHKE